MISVADELEFEAFLGSLPEDKRTLVLKMLRRNFELGQEDARRIVIQDC